MTTPLTPEERTRVDALFELRKGTEATPQGGPFSARPASPGPTNSEVTPPDDPSAEFLVRALTRLSVWLADQGFIFQTDAISAIGVAEDPFLALRGQLKVSGASDSEIERVFEVVRDLHAEDWRLDYSQDMGRTRKGNLRQTEGQITEDGSAYLTALDQLRGIGIEGEQAHEVLAEWGFLNPLYTDVNAQVENKARALAIMRATGEYTGPVTPAQLLGTPTLESALQLLEETDFSSTFNSFEDFSINLGAETGLGTTRGESAQNVVASETGEPQLGDDDPAAGLIPIGNLPEGFVVRGAPRPPGKLRGSPTRPGLSPGDADLVAGSGPRGEQLAGRGALPVLQEPEYFLGDNSNIFVGLGPEVTTLYQTMLVDAGWLDPEDFRAEQGANGGGAKTWAAMNDAMEAANRTDATTWIEAAQRSAEARDRNDIDGIDHEPVPVWTPSTFLKPDPDFLNQTVKGAFRQQLGREPTAAEVSSLISSLSAEYRDLFDIAEQRDRIAFEQGIAANDASLGPIDPLTGERTVVPLAEGETFRTVKPGVESLTGVDPLASFQEAFEARFAEEMARGRQRVTQRDARRDIMGSIFAIDAAVGGGR